MNDTVTRAQYSTDLSRSNIEQALIAAGKDIDRLQPSNLALLADFHTMGRIATSQLVNQIGITSANTLLDAGSGIGGTARYVADQGGFARHIDEHLVQDRRRNPYLPMKNGAPSAPDRHFVHPAEGALKICNLYIKDNLYQRLSKRLSRVS